MRERVVTVSQFKAKCLAYFTDVEAGTARITVTRRGKPVAVIGPARKAGWESPANSLAGALKIESDIVHFAPRWGVTAAKPQDI